MNPAPMPYVTALYAGVIGLLLIVLAALVSRMRGRLKVGLGDGGHVELQRAIRVHANAVEWSLPYLLLMLLAELNRAPLPALHTAGIALVVGRVLHASGVARSSGRSFGRMTGTAITWFGLMALAIFDIWAGMRVVLL